MSFIHANFIFLYCLGLHLSAVVVDFSHVFLDIIVGEHRGLFCFTVKLIAHVSKGKRGNPK